MEFFRASPCVAGSNGSDVCCHFENRHCEPARSLLLCAVAFLVALLCSGSIDQDFQYAMPEAFSATVAEREAELVALQSAFDEYIASSRELEEELDAELAKMQEKLAESTAANAALSSQLENIAPQLASLETALTESRLKLKEEQKLRRHAEQAQDEADQRLREMEMSLQHVREECDVVHEELAFKENEVEETRLELEVEKQQLLNQVNQLNAELQKAAARSRSVVTDDDQDSNAAAVSKATTVDSVPEVDEGYVKKLEEELELVTEQLIETEKRLSETEADLKSLNEKLRAVQDQGRSEDDDDLIRNLQTEIADRMDIEQKLRDEVDLAREELVLAKEEIQLQQEEIQAYEEEAKNLSVKLEEERAQFREKSNALQIQAKEADIASKASLGDAARVAATIQEAGMENEKLQEEILALESALENARQDYQGVLEELEAVNARFDEVREEARQEGRDAAQDELRSAMKADVESEVADLKEHLEKLTMENNSLQTKVDETKLELASIRDSGQARGEATNETRSELEKQLEDQLNRTKEDLTKKDREMVALSEKLEARVTQAEKKVEKLEQELRSTKGQLAEAESHLIVLRREKERSQLSPIRKSQSVDKTDMSDAPSFPSIEHESKGNADDDSRGLKSSPGHRARSKSPSSVMKLEIALEEEKQKNQKLEEDYQALQDQKRMGDVRIKRLEEDLKFLHKELFANGGDHAVATQMSRLSSLATNEKTVDVMIPEGGESKKIEEIVASKDPKLMAEELLSIEKKLVAQREYNAQLLSKMLHLQGNIQVYCRVRPMTLVEIEKGQKSVVESLSETEVGCFDSRTNKWKSFVFDRVWGPDQSQQSVFQDVEPLALSVVDGFNACIFAYGQTGSGKTYTMEGIAETQQHGISYRTIQKIFHLLNLRAQQQRAAELFVGSDNDDEPAKEVAFSFSLEIGMLEIYNEEVYDLLNTSGASMAEKKQGAQAAGGKASLDIRRSQDGRIEVPNLTKIKVSSIQEVMDILSRGNANRATATTDMNEHSSRSHMVLSVDVYSGLEEVNMNKGTLFLVDLAGSERVRKSNVAGDQLKEAGFINRSLSALGNVMEALDRKASHVPYRDSKLTYLLQDSLGGNSRTMMVVAICPTDGSHDESVHALQFATRVRRIQIGAAQRNVTSKNLEETVKALTDEMRTLTRAKERTESQLHTLKRDNARVQDKLQSLNKSRAQSRTDSKTLEVLKKNNDDMAQRWQKEKASREEQAQELEKTQKELRSLQQQLGKNKSKLSSLEQKLEDKERELDVANKQIVNQSNAKSAASHRARRDQVLGNRSTGIPVPSTPSKDSTANGSVAGQSTDTSDVSGIRSQVLELLEKYDKGKVNRIDIIMEKFKGKEALLLEKMTQRYEADSASVSNSAQQRSQIALERHQERMRKIREKKGLS